MCLYNGHPQVWSKGRSPFMKEENMYARHTCFPLNKLTDVCVANIKRCKEAKI